MPPDNATRTSLLTAQQLDRAGIGFNDSGLVTGVPDAADVYHVKGKTDWPLKPHEVLKQVGAEFARPGSGNMREIEFHRLVLAGWQDQAREAFTRVQRSFGGESPATPSQQSDLRARKKGAYAPVILASKAICEGAAVLFPKEEAERDYSGACTLGRLLGGLFTP